MLAMIVMQSTLENLLKGVQLHISMLSSSYAHNLRWQSKDVQELDLYS